MNIFTAMKYCCLLHGRVCVIHCQTHEPRSNEHFLQLKFIVLSKGSLISKALSRMKIYMYKQNGNFVKEKDTSAYNVV